MKLCFLIKKLFYLVLREVFINEMRKIYPHTFVQIHEKLCDNLDFNKKNDDYLKFLSTHNDSLIKNQFKKMILKIT